MNVHTAKQPATNLWVAVWKLLRLRLLIFLSGFRHATLRRKIGILVLAIVVTAFAGFIFYLSWILLQFLQSPTVQTYFEDF